jgi:hypothetical protein
VLLFIETLLQRRTLLYKETRVKGRGKKIEKTKNLTGINKASGEHILGAFHASGVCILAVRSAKTIAEIRSPRNQMLPEAAEQKNVNRGGSFSPATRFPY